MPLGWSDEDSSLQQLLSGDRSGTGEEDFDKKTNCYCFGANIREHGLGSDATGAKEVPLRTSKPIVVREWSWVLPVPEPDAIVIWTSTQINNDTKNDQSCNCDDLD